MLRLDEQIGFSVPPLSYGAQPRLPHVLAPSSAQIDVSETKIYFIMEALLLHRIFFQCVIYPVCYLNRLSGASSLERARAKAHYTQRI